MATATPTSRGALTPLVEPDQGSESQTVRGTYRCECGHELRVFGGGRHRVFFELTDANLNDPVMNRICPACGRGLPGKNPLSV